MDGVPLTNQAAAEANGQRGWIASPSFDLTFFVLPLLLGVAISAVGMHQASLIPIMLIVGSYFVGVPHYLATFAFFMGDDNRRYTKKFWSLFYAGPVLICLSVALLYATHLAPVVHGVLFVWNVYHVANQSAGILSLYRRLGGGIESERWWAHRTILFANASMAFWYVDRVPAVWSALTAVNPTLPNILRFIFLAAAIVSAVGYGLRVRQRTAPLSTAETCFLASSLLLFTPYLWVSDANFATLGMLMGHFVQYLALVWLLNRRKYQPPSGSRSQKMLGRMSGSWRAGLLFMGVVGVAFYALDKGTRVFNSYQLFMVLFNSLALVHFYLDGLIWAFKNPYIRQSVGPYLTLESHRLKMPTQK